MTSGALKHLPVRQIRPNQHNPRLIFRAEELQELASSIQDHGVQVPISVYKDGRFYVLIDGERRWRACQMINRTEVPAIIYPKPTELQNIVYMFNIHRFRRDWDPLPTAMKLEDLKKLVEREEGTTPSEAELASLTGMSRGAVRRCKLIMEIPEKDREEILRELALPEHERRITTDLFVECQRSVRTISKYLPELADSEEPLRRALIEKYRLKVIVNVVHMRKVARIVRSGEKGVPKQTIRETIRDLIRKPDFSLEQAYANVAWAYELRSVRNHARSLIDLIANIGKGAAQIDDDSVETLTELRRRINELLRGRG